MVRYSFTVAVAVSSFLMPMVRRATGATSSPDGQERKHYLRRNLLSGSDVELRIIGGDDTPEDRYPYYVALLRKGGSFTCGGTLIAPDVILTAAHCFSDDLDLALIGKHAVGSTDGVEERKIAKTYKHPDFDYFEKRFDQMLITLEAPSTYPYLKHINLDESLPEVGGIDITTIGLGVTSLRGNRPSVLQEVTSTYIPNDECKKRKNQLGSYADAIDFEHMCVEGPNDSGGQCYGDSGGPQLLLGATSDEDIQVGIVSWGVDCGMSDLPSIGSRTSASSFIKDKTCELSSDPPPILCSGPQGPDTPTPSASPTAGATPDATSV